jgi:hypothetical protein
VPSRSKITVRTASLLSQVATMCEISRLAARNQTDKRTTGKTQRET